MRKEGKDKFHLLAGKETLKFGFRIGLISCLPKVERKPVVWSSSCQTRLHTRQPDNTSSASLETNNVWSKHI